MTYQYIQHFHTARPFIFLNLLRKWKGGVYKLVWVEFIIFIVLYTIISLIYRLVLQAEAKNHFELVVLWVSKFTDLVPVVFILSFYIGLVISRFWAHYKMIPWSVSPALAVATYVRGNDERSRLMRRTIIRYINLALVMVSQRINVPVRRRFKDMNSLISAGLLTEEEKKIIDELNTPHPKYFMPLTWSLAVILRAQKEGVLRNKFGIVTLVKMLKDFQQGCLNLLMMDYVCLPLVYTQVVTIAVYTYALACLIGRQYLDPKSAHSEKHSLDLKVPFFTLIELLVYLGSLKLGETLLNPMGTDDDDFELNVIIDFCWETSIFVADMQDSALPEIVKDTHWEQTNFELPHTLQSAVYNTPVVAGSLSSKVGVTDETEKRI